MTTIAWSDNERHQGSFGTILDGMVMFSIIWFNARGSDPEGFGIVVRGAQSTTLPGRYASVDAARKSQEAESWLARMLEGGQ